MAGKPLPQTADRTGHRHRRCGADNLHWSIASPCRTNPIEPGDPGIIIRTRQRGRRRRHQSRAQSDSCAILQSLRHVGQREIDADMRRQRADIVALGRIFRQQDTQRRKAQADKAARRQWFDPLNTRLEPNDRGIGQHRRRLPFRAEPDDRQSQCRRQRAKANRAHRPSTPPDRQCGKAHTGEGQ